MYQANKDLGFFQDTKVTKGIYMRESSKYKVVASEAPSVHSSSIAMFYRAVEFWIYIANVVRFQLALGG